MHRSSKAPTVLISDHGGGVGGVLGQHRRQELL